MVGVVRALVVDPVYQAEATLQADLGLVVSASPAVRRIPRTQLLGVSASAPDPIVAARIANARAADLVARSTANATEEIDEALVRVRSELASRDEALATTESSYRAAAGVVISAGDPVAVASRLDDVQRQLMPLDAALQQLDAGAPAGDFHAVGLDPIVQSARSALLAVERERARSLLRYGPEHPSIAALNEFVARARDRLRLAEEAVIVSLRVDRDRLSLEATSLQAALVSTTRDAQQRLAVERSRRELDNQTRAIRDDIDGLRSRELSILQARQRLGNGLRVVERAVPPATPQPGDARWYYSAAALLMAASILIGRIRERHRFDSGRPAPALLRTHSWPPSRESGRRVA